MILGKTIAVPRQGYQRVDVYIEPAAGAAVGYAVKLQIDGGIDVPPRAFGLDPAALKQKANPAEYGKALGQMLFADETIRSAYRDTLNHSQGRADGVRVRLWLEAP